MKQSSILLIVIALLLLGCDQKAEETNAPSNNQAPVWTSLDANPTAIDPGATTTITYSAEDPDGDLLEFSCTNPEVVYLSDSTFRWTAPDQPGLFNLTFIASDRALEMDSTLHINVNLPTPTLTARMVSEAQSLLSWDNPQGLADSIRIERSLSVSSEFELVALTAINPASYLDSSLTPMTVYYYRIASQGLDSHSAYSNVATVYTAVMPDSGLFAWYPLNGDAADSTDQGHNGSLFGAAPIQDRFGNAGQALNFSVLGAHIELPPEVVQMSAFTFVAWISWSDNTVANQPLLYAWNNQGGSMILTPKAAPHFKFSLNDGQTTESLQALPPLSTNAWIMVAVRVANGQGTLFRNDLPVSLGTMNLTPGQVAGSGAWLGGNPDSGVYFKGSMDDVRLYNRALEDTEIELLYHEGGWHI